jgi:hypothetical protein
MFEFFTIVLFLFLVLIILGCVRVNKGLEEDLKQTKIALEAATAELHTRRPKKSFPVSK